MTLKVEEMKTGDSVGDPRDQSTGIYEDAGETVELAEKHDLIIRSGKNDPGKNSVVVSNGSIVRLINKQDFETNWVMVDGTDFPIL